MQMNGEQRIPVPQPEVWRALNDPELIRACIPGCETVEKAAADEFHLTLIAAVGPIKAKFRGKLKLTDIHPPQSYNLSFEGQGAAGFSRGDASVRLAPDGDETLLSYSAKATVGGKLAQIGSRMIDMTARKIADEFFANLAATLTQSEAAGGAQPDGAVAEKDTVENKRRLVWLWTAIAFCTAAIIYVLGR